MINEIEAVRRIDRRQTMQDIGNDYAKQVIDAPIVVKLAITLCIDKEEFTKFMDMLAIDSKEVIKAIRKELRLSERIRADELTA